jgi:Protein of unknown function (DUF1569)
MKTLADSDARQEIMRRLSSICPASQRRWGKMTVTEMICHLSDAFRVGMGEKQANPVSTWLWRYGMKWIALSAPIKWPHGVQTVPECEAGVGGTPPSEFESDVSELKKAFERFTRQPRDYELQPHPIFGQLSEKEWMRWGYLHMDHHLRQFGA